MSSPRLRTQPRGADPRAGRPVAVPLLPGERAFVVRAIRAYATEHTRLKADLLHMFEHAVPLNVFRELELQEPRCARGLEIGTPES